MEKIITAPKISSALAKETLWRRGVLVWLLDENQKALYDVQERHVHFVF